MKNKYIVSICVNYTEYTIRIFHFLIFFIYYSLGIYSWVDTPVPIPNTEVKHSRGDGTTFKSVGE